MTMKHRLNVGFVVTLSGRWPRQLPERRLADYGDWLKKNLPAHCTLTAFERVVCTREEMEQCADAFAAAKVDLVIQLYGAFTGDDIACGLADRLSKPMILWAPREEQWVRQDRLYANALCCATMNGAALKRIDAPARILYGNKEEERVQKELIEELTAQALVHSMKGMTFGLFGYRPTAFYNCAFDETVIRRTFGIDMEETDLKVVFDRMSALPWSEVEAEMKRVSGTWDATALPDGHLENHARLYLVLKELMPEQKYDYAAIKCWPEMGNLHTTPCAVLGRLADEGISIACEGDVDAGLAGVMQNQLTGLPTFVTDLIDLDEGKNTVTFWHCGNAAPSLHDERDGVAMCNHPLLGQGTAFWCALKEGPVTAARLTNIDGRYRLFLLSGTGVKTVRNTRGCMVNVKVETPVLDLVQKIADSGMAHHYSLVWADVADRMARAAQLLDIPVIRL